MQSSKSNPLHKKYKALILDVDGTIINGQHALPSKKVSEAIGKVKNSISVGVATSRPFFILKHISSHLKLSGPSIILGGASVVDSVSGKVLWRKLIDKDDLYKIRKIALNFNCKVFYTANEDDYVDFKNKEIVQVWIPELEPQEAVKFMDQLSKIPTIAHYQLPAWTKGKISVVIGHSEATKQHGILEIAKILGISTHEIIAVGDGYNDFPLLMACGLKVAMGNAVEDLKAIADYVAPSVEEDGVADVIERFVL